MGNTTQTDLLEDKELEYDKPIWERPKQQKKMIELSGNKLSSDEAKKILKNFPDILKKVDEDSLNFLLKNPKGKKILIDKKMVLPDGEYEIGPDFQLDSIYDMLKEIESYEEMMIQIDKQKELEKMIAVKEGFDGNKTQKIISSDLLAGSKFEKDLMKFTGSGESAKEIIGALDGMWLDFFNQRCDFLDEGVIRNMATASMIALMETLSKNPESQEKFFKNLKSLKGNTAISAFNGLWGLFKDQPQLQDTVKYMEIVTKTIDKNKVSVGSGKKIKELADPYFFKKNILESSEKTQEAIEKYLVVDQDYSFTGYSANSPELKELKSVAGNFQISAEGVAGLKNFNTFMKTVEKSKVSYKSQALALGDTINTIKKGLEFFGETDFVETSVGQVINLILKVMGFKGGYEGFQKEYLNTKIKLSAEEKLFIKDIATQYNVKKENGKGFEENLVNKTMSEASDGVKKIFDIDKRLLKETIMESEKKSKLVKINPELLSMLLANKAGLSKLLQTNYQKNGEVQINSELYFKNHELIIDLFLEFVLKNLQNNKELHKFFEKTNRGADDMVITILTAFTEGDIAIEGASYGFFHKVEFMDLKAVEQARKSRLAREETARKQKEAEEAKLKEEKNKEEQKNINGETISMGGQSENSIEDATENNAIPSIYDKKYIENLSKKKPNIDYLKDVQFNGYLRSLEKSHNLPLFSLSAMMQVESGGRNYDGYGNVIGSPVGAMGLFQFMPSSVTGLQFNRSDPVLGAKYAAKALQDQGVVQGKFDFATTVARYNCGAGTYFYSLGNQAISSTNIHKLPFETQQHVAQNLVLVDAANGVDYTSKRYYKLFQRTPGFNLLVPNFLSRIPKNSVKRNNETESETNAEKLNDKKTLEAMVLSEISGIGDSTFEGMGVYLASLQGNRSKTTEFLKDKLPSVLAKIDKSKTKSFLIQGGFNDIADSVDKPIANMEEMIKLVKKKNIQPVLCTLYSVKKNATIYPYQKNIHSFNQKIRELGNKYGIPVIDYDNFVEKTPGYISGDGAHLTPIGYEKAVDYLKNFLNPLATSVASSK
ncbi:MAG TPA: GDSL-type esterase/lipase family protein [Candidatus Absconditabacterales bacterium]|nr:GDSL-type esterase/lipase family protein [Candidatus Absconditabacterales bacterium]